MTKKVELYDNLAHGQISSAISAGAKWIKVRPEAIVGKINSPIVETFETFRLYTCKMASLYDHYCEEDASQHKRIMTIRPEIMKRRFLDLYIQMGHVQQTCNILGMVRRTVYHWKQWDPDFAKAFEEANALVLQLLEDEAMRRAFYGVEKPVYQGGKLAGYVREYSDTLLVVLLKARDPHKYKERFAGELTGADGKPLSMGMTINHVHSAVPIANREEDIINIPYADVVNTVPQLPKPSTEEIDPLLL